MLQGIQRHNFLEMNCKKYRDPWVQFDVGLMPLKLNFSKKSRN